MGSLDPAKILVILVIALIVLGPERLPRVARQLGAAWRELTRVREQVTEEVRSAFPDVEIPKIPKIPSPSAAVSSFFTDLKSGASAAAATSASGAVELDQPEVGLDASEQGRDPSEPRHRQLPDRERQRDRSIAPSALYGNDLGGTLVANPLLGEFTVVFDDPSMN